MLGKHLIVVVLIIVVSLGTLVFYGRRAVKTPAEAWQLIETWTGIVKQQIALPRELSFETISHGLLYQYHEYFVIENSEEWDELWSSASALTPQPEIDFSTHLVIVTFMGQRGSSGYHISIERIIEMENEILVEVRETYPGRIATLAIITNPSHIVKIERVQKPIVFKVQQFMTHAYDENWNPYDGIIIEFLGEHRVEAGRLPFMPSKPT